ncbi:MULTISPECIES: hypothetical protein [unclassified Sphingobacterium]|uniref:hypothetical protein n=1 Tax=unclassified Sphingobacterium TaxID=2609468 RepID=UPI0010532C0E|nr:MULTISPECIES: hypothetical protein [unclassified Sphingobacterium]MCS3554732.1 hypothetical protein [Sphingobacterium sp. JUb21]TCR07719.1 hypothetical protein EDF66_105352 [Sphingobacterium sp. JUb20]
MRNAIFIIIILIISIVCLSVTVFNKKINTFYKNADKENLSYRDQFYYNYDYFVISNESVPLNQVLMLSDTLGTSKSLADIVKSFAEPKIYIRYSQYDCSDCVNAIFKLLNSYPAAQRNSFVIISDYDDHDKFMVTRKSKFWHLDHYNIDFSSNGSQSSTEPPKLGIPIEGKGVPFVFTVNALMQTDHFFTPEKGDLDSFKRYLNAVLKKMKSNK